MMEWLCQKVGKCGKCGKSVEYFPKKLWKSVVEWGIGTGCRDMIEKLSYEGVS